MVVNDAQLLLRDIAGDAAQKTATKINPHEDDLNQIDHAAEDNTWHDAPDVNGLKQQAKSQFDKNKPLSRGDFKDSANKAGRAGAGTDDPEDAARNVDPSQVDAKGGIRHGLSDLKNKASQNIPDEHKDRARETKEKTQAQTKDYLRSKMPQERRDQTIWRLKKMVAEIQGHSDCMLAWIFCMVI